MGNNSKNKIVAAVAACKRTNDNVYMNIQFVPYMSIIICLFS
jgi:hypothetical protein